MSGMVRGPESVVIGGYGYGLKVVEGLAAPRTPAQPQARGGTATPARPRRLRRGTARGGTARARCALSGLRCGRAVLSRAPWAVCCLALAGLWACVAVVTRVAWVLRGTRFVVPPRSGVLIADARSDACPVRDRQRPEPSRRAAERSRCETKQLQRRDACAVTVPSPVSINLSLSLVQAELADAEDALGASWFLPAIIDDPIAVVRTRSPAHGGCLMHHGPLSSHVARRSSKPSRALDPSTGSSKQMRTKAYRHASSDCVVVSSPAVRAVRKYGRVSDSSAMTTLL